MVFFFSLVFFIIAIWNFRGDYHHIRIFPFIISLIFLILVLLNSTFLTPLNKLWLKFGLMLGAIISPIVMSFIFFLVVTPTGIIMKIIGKDLLNKRFDQKKTSYWIKREKKIETMKRQF